MYNFQYFDNKEAVVDAYGEDFGLIPANVGAVYGDYDGIIFKSNTDEDHPIIEFTSESEPSPSEESYRTFSALEEAGGYFLESNWQLHENINMLDLEDMNEATILSVIYAMYKTSVGMYPPVNPIKVIFPEGTTADATHLFADVLVEMVAESDLYLTVGDAMEVIDEKFEIENLTV